MFLKEIMNEWVCGSQSLFMHTLVGASPGGGASTEEGLRGAQSIAEGEPYLLSLAPGEPTSG